MIHLCLILGWFCSFCDAAIGAGSKHAHTRTIACRWTPNSVGIAAVLQNCRMLGCHRKWTLLDIEKSSSAPSAECGGRPGVQNPLFAVRASGTGRRLTREKEKQIANVTMASPISSIVVHVLCCHGWIWGSFAIAAACRPGERRHRDCPRAIFSANAFVAKAFREPLQGLLTRVTTAPEWRGPVALACGFGL